MALSSVQPEYNKNRLFTISQAAKFLNVSSKTLRRWDKKGILFSRRTKGGQRRYLKKELLEFAGRKELINTFVRQPPVKKSFNSNIFRTLSYSLTSLLIVIILVLILSASGVVAFPFFSKLLEMLPIFSSEILTPVPDIYTQETSKVQEKQTIQELVEETIKENKTGYLTLAPTEYLSPITFYDTVHFNTISSDLLPSLDDAYNIGSSTLEWKDLYLDGKAYIDEADIENLMVGYNATINNNLTVSKNIKVDKVDSNLLPAEDGTYHLGSSSSEWQDLYIDGVIYTDAFQMSTGATSGYVLTTDASGVGTWTDVSSVAGPWTLVGSNLYPDSTSYNVSIGITSPSAKLHSLSTTEQLRLGYDASNYTSFTVNSGGDLTISPNDNTGGLIIQGHATSPNIVGGYSGNSIANGVYGSSILGGGESSSVNSVTSGNHSTIIGGKGNTINTSHVVVNSSNLIGSGINNSISSTYTLHSSVIVGGQQNAISDQASESFIGGGYSNAISGWGSYNFIGGGSGNVASSDSGYATIVGGQSNTATHYDFVGGGTNNAASGSYAVISGGGSNTASGYNATIPGGRSNTASGDYSFAAGRRAKATATGAFVLTDSTDADFTVGTADVFGTRFAGGYWLTGGNVGIGTTGPSQALDVNGNARIRSIGSAAYNAPVNQTSDGTLTTATSDIFFKKDINTISNPLDKILSLRGVTFRWKEDEDERLRIGMIAQEVQEIVPELVFKNNVDGYLGMYYGETTALLVEGIKEQQEIILNQQDSIEELSLTIDEIGEVVLTEEQENIILGEGEENDLSLAALEARISTFESDLGLFKDETNETMALLEEEIDNLNTKVDLLSDRLDLFELEATVSALLGDNVLGEATSSGIFKVASDSASLDMNLVLYQDLNVLGKTTLSDLGLTGNLTAGLISVNGLEASINALANTLRLQSLPAAGNLDIFDGIIVMTPEGNIITTGAVKVKKVEIETEGEGISAGKVTIEAGEDRTVVETSALTDNSLIFVTPEKAIAVGALKTSDHSFEIKLDQPTGSDLNINWWLIN